MRSLRNRTVTVLLVGVLAVGLILGVVFSSWHVIAITSSVVVTAWLVWISRRIHITASEVRRLASSVVSVEHIERLHTSDEGLRREFDTMLKAIRADNSDLRQEILRETRALNHQLVAPDGGSDENISQALQEFQREVQDIRDRLDSLSESIPPSPPVADSALLDSLGKQLETTGAVVDKTKRQLNRAVRRQVELYGMVEILDSSVNARIDQFMDELRWEFRVALRSLSAPKSEHDAAGNSQAVQPSSDRRFDLQKYLYYLSYHIPREVAAQQQLESLYQPEGAHPLLGGWALTPSGMLDVAHVISKDAPEVVVECGSGTSTMWIALALRNNGGGHVFALEHDPHFARETRRQLSLQGLSSFATVVDAPIREHNSADGVVEWYDVSGIQSVERIDLLVVDGPPQALGDLRKGAVDLLSSRFSDGAHVFADDVNRDAERTMVNEWMKKHPALQKHVTSTPVQAHLVWTTMETA